MLGLRKFKKKDKTMIDAITYKCRKDFVEDNHGLAKFQFFDRSPSGKYRVTSRCGSFCLNSLRAQIIDVFKEGINTWVILRLWDQNGVNGMIKLRQHTFHHFFFDHLA